MLQASVIIPTYNRAHLLKHCLEHILNQTVTNYEVICVDDASTDNTPKLEILKNIKYIRLDTHKGCWYARNFAMKLANGDIIIFIDSDILASKNFIEDHLSFYEKNTDIAVQGVVRHIRKPESFGVKTLRIDGISPFGLVIQNSSIPKKWLLKTGLFDEHMFMGYWDIELGMRLKNSGVKIVYAFKKCIAYHVDGYPTEEKLKSTFLKFQDRGKTSVYFIQKLQGKTLERFAIPRILFISFLFQTPKWAEKRNAFNMLKKSIDSPFFFIFPILKEIMKYHYRAKGIKEILSR